MTTGRYAERVALEPWDYGGPEHVNHVPYVAILDRHDAIVDVEDGLGDRSGLGRRVAAADCSSLTIVDVSPGSGLRALLVPAVPVPGPDVVRVTTLGCTDIDGDESCGRWLGQRPGSLLKFLVCRRYRPVHAQHIAEALWGHVGFESSGTVRQCVHELREKLDSGRAETAAKLIVTRQCGYALSASLLVDADDFAVHVRRGIAALGRGQQEIAVVHLRRAVAMYRGDFLSDEPQSDWARLERERLGEHMEDALGALADVYLAAGDAPATTSCLRRLAEMLPHDDEVHRRLLAVLLAQGNHSHAWRCYQVFCDRLSRDFARPPGFTLAELAPEN